MMQGTLAAKCLPYWIINRIGKKSNRTNDCGVIEMRSQSGKYAVRTWVVVENHIFGPLIYNLQFFHL